MRIFWFQECVKLFLSRFLYEILGIAMLLSYIPCSFLGWRSISIVINNLNAFKQFCFSFLEWSETVYFIRRPLTGLLYQHRTMIVEQSVE
jgi:hypothetical protein